MSAATWGVEPLLPTVPTVRRAPARTAPRGATVGPAAAPLRLTARGRLVVVALSTALAVGAVVSGQSAVAETPRSAQEVVAHTVAPGETLWQIAGAVAEPGEDVRDVVQALMSLNGLTGGGLQAGQQLLVPVD